MGRHRTSVFTVAAMTATLAVAVLAGCSQAPTNSPAPAASSTGQAGPSSAPTASAAPAPKFYPSGTAKGNKPYFDSVNEALIAANPSANGKDVIDALVSAGFDKANMQLTPDKTTIGRSVDSVLFSVHIGGDCLLGQFSGSEYTSSVQAALNSGACLVGQTRPIDW